MLELMGHGGSGVGLQICSRSGYKMLDIETWLRCISVLSVSGRMVFLCFHGVVWRWNAFFVVLDKLLRWSFNSCVAFPSSAFFSMHCHYHLNALLVWCLYLSIWRSSRCIATIFQCIATVCFLLLSVVLAVAITCVFYFIF